MKTGCKMFLCFALAVFWGIGIKPIPSYAATLSQDGIEVSLSTDKDSYSLNEQIVSSLTVTNTNEYEVSNITLQSIIPEDYRAAEDVETVRTVSRLLAGESVTLTVTYEGAGAAGHIAGPVRTEKTDNIAETNSTEVENSVNPELSEDADISEPVMADTVVTQEPTDFSADTGMEEQVPEAKHIVRNVIIGIVVFLAVVAAGVIFLRKKQILALLLCVSVMGVTVYDNNLSVEAAQIESREININKNIKVNSKEMSLQSVVRYEVSAPEADSESPRGDSGSFQAALDLNVSEYQYHQSSDGDFYVLSDKISAISGSASGIEAMDAIGYVIRNTDGDTLQEGKIDVSQTWSASGVGFDYGCNFLTLTADMKDDTSIVKQYVIVNAEEENARILGIDIDADSDGDGFPDYLEKPLGMDPQNADSDGDGLPDDVEFLTAGLSPILYDTDEDGIMDAEEDSDGDGLTNFEEYQLGTLLSDRDTDWDGLPDGDEVLVYKTNPLDADTDGDGLSDAKEIEIGSDPLTAESTFDCTLSYNDDSLKVLPSVELTGLGADQINDFYMDVVTSGLLADENIPGYIDCAFSINEIGDFGEAVLSFELDPELFSDENFEPAVYWFDEETQRMERLEEQTLNGNVLSARISHFSRYIVLNSYEFSRVWMYELLYDEDAADTYRGIDVAFVIDSSGSMDWNDPSDNRKTVTNDYIAHLTEYDCAAVIDFDDQATVCSGFTSDKDALYDAVGTIDSSGGTSLSAGISAALNLFEAMAYDGEERAKCIIMLTDGDGSYSTTYTATASDMGVVIYTVGLGSDVQTSVLTAMAEGTGGRYYYADNAGELNGIFEHIAEESDLKLDSDCDGISDYHEKQMANGSLRLGNGVPLTGINYLSADTDGDGLLDGQEIIIHKSGDIVYAFLLSNPTLVDTDGDSINDDEDVFPLVPDVTEILLYRSDHEEGKKPDGSTEEDMEYNDKSFADLLKISGWFVNADIPEYEIWAEMRSLFKATTLMADPGVKKAAFEMVAQFESGVGGTYSNPALTEAVKNHKNVKKTYDSIVNFVTDKLSNNYGDIKELEYNSGSRVTQEYKDTIPKAFMDSLSDHVNGLGITIHDFSGYTVTITNFRRTTKGYSGTLSFHYYDDFGLDSGDLTEKTLYGIIDWYTLQHYTRFNGAYVPFLTYVDFTIDFEGSY